MATSLLLGASALGDSVAVSVVDLGCGTANCAPDSHADIIRHDASTGEITLHYMTETGLDLIESDFTLDDLVLEAGNEGVDYSAGNIIFNNNGTSGTGASASYEVNGEISNLRLAATGSGYDRNLVALDDHGVRSFRMAASLRNANGTGFSDIVGATGTAFVSPFPGDDPANSNRSWFTAFRIESAGLGGPPNSAVRINVQSFNPLTDPDMGNILALTDGSGRITSILRAGDVPNNSENWLHTSSQSIPAEKNPDPNLYYFNQNKTNGLGDVWWESFGFPQPTIYYTDNNNGLNEIEFTQTPVIRFYRGGEIMHVSLDSTTKGFTSDPLFHDETVDLTDAAVLADLENFDGSTGLVYAPNHNSSEASFRVSWSRRGPISEIIDFNPGSGYDSIPTFTLSDPDGQGSGATITLESTEAFTGGPKKMVFAESEESILLPGTGWKAMPGDFNGDENPDLFWWNPAIGSTNIWILKNGHIDTTKDLPLVENTLVPAVADLDDDGKSEIFWWDSVTGSTWVWGITPGSGDWITLAQASMPVTDIGWELVTNTQRFGRDAILWQNRNDGTTGTWTMSLQAPHVLETAADFTWATGELLIPGANWEIVGTGDMNGDGQTGDLLWHSNDEYDRIAFWMIGQSNFLEGDYLTYNGQEVTIDARLGGIGTYTTDRHLNIIWNDGGQVVNWEMARSEQASSAQTEESGPPALADEEARPSLRDDEEGIEADQEPDELVDNENSNATDDEEAAPAAPVLGPLAYRISGAWSMGEDGLLTATGFSFFEGYPANLGEGSNSNSTGGSSNAAGGAADGLPDDIPDFGGGVDGGGSDDGLPGSNGITVPNGVNVCDYLCQLDRNDPDGWPPEFQTAPPEVIQSVWDLLIDGLLEQESCDPCPAAPTGACCNENTGVCVDDLAEADCIFPGTEWLGAGSTCDDCD